MLKERCLHRGLITFFSEYLGYRSLSEIASVCGAGIAYKKGLKEQFNVIFAENHSFFGSIPAPRLFRGMVWQEVF
jgi:hypothetical protein